MIRLHVLHYKIVGSSVAKHTSDVPEPLFSEVPVDRIHYRDLLIHDHVRVISHARGDIILTFKKIYPVIINACVEDIV